MPLFLDTTKIQYISHNQNIPQKMMNDSGFATISPHRKNYKNDGKSTSNRRNKLRESILDRAKQNRDKLINSSGM